MSYQTTPKFSRLELKSVLLLSLDLLLVLFKLKFHFILIKNCHITN